MWCGKTCPPPCSEFGLVQNCNKNKWVKKINFSDPLIYMGIFFLSLGLKKSILVAIGATFRN